MLWTFSMGGGGVVAQLHSIAFGGVFPYITEPILDDGNINKCPNSPPKSDHFTSNFIKVSTFYKDRFPQRPKMVIYAFLAKCRELLVRGFRKRPP